jgi:hypothetical protein
MQPGHTVALIRTMTLEAVVGKDWPDLAVEINSGGGRSGGQSLQRNRRGRKNSPFEAYTHYHSCAWNFDLLYAQNKDYVIKKHYGMPAILRMRQAHTFK